MKYLFLRLASFVVVPVAVMSVQPYSSNPIGNTTFWWLFQFLILIIYFISAFVFFNSGIKKGIIILILYLAWIVVSISRGFFIAQTYFEWKGLVENTFILFLPFIIFSTSNLEVLQNVLSYFIKIALPFAIFVLPFVGMGAWGWYLFPISFLMLFFPTLKLRWKILLFSISVIAILGDITVRSHVLKYGIPILLLLIYYLRHFFAAELVMKIAQKVLMVVPWIFFGLAASGIFNVFNFKDYINVKKINNSVEYEGQDVTQDSRTFIYEEVLSSAKKYNYWWLGRSPAKGNETKFFAKEMIENIGTNERLKNEANITNVFTWMGIIGLIVYFLVFVKASSLALYDSNNIYSKLLGLYIAFRWAYAWVEDYYNFDMNNFTIWLMLGTCFSTSFRKMNNLEVKLWARGIFEKRYKLLNLSHTTRNFSKINLLLNK